jgi:wobble nucleotide-excising tRNase
MDGDEAQEFFACDLWVCPICGHQVIVGMGNRPIASRFDADFDDQLEAHRRAGDPIIRYWSDSRQAPSASESTRRATREARFDSRLPLS